MKDIEGFEGRYAVSKDGSIYSYKSQKFLRPFTNKERTWYLSISLGHNKPRKVHRLVAQAFIPNPKKLPEVNHKNGKKWDNRVENLEWVTRKENQRHASINGYLRPVIGEKNWRHVLTESQVKEIKLRFMFSNISQRKLAKEYGVSHTTIKGIINGWYWKHVI